MEQFLQFVYTGELEGAVSHELELLAIAYEIQTLQLLCQSPLPIGEDVELAGLVIIFYWSSSSIFLSIIPQKRVAP